MALRSQQEYINSLHRQIGVLNQKIKRLEEEGGIARELERALKRALAAERRAERAERQLKKEKELRKVDQAENAILKKENTRLKSELERTYEEKAGLRKELGRERKGHTSDSQRSADLQKQLEETEKKLKALEKQKAELEKEKENLEEKCDAETARDRLAGEGNGIPTAGTPIGREKRNPRVNLRQDTGNHQRGGQPGHEQHTLQSVANPDITEFCFWEADDKNCDCSKCPHRGKDCQGSSELKPTGKFIEKEETDLVVQVKKTSHRFIVYQCPHLEKQVHCYIPQDLQKAVNYGPGVKTFAILQNVVANTPMQKTADLISGITDDRIHFVASFVAGQDRKYAHVLRLFMDDLRILLLLQKLVHWDDTVIMVDTQRACMRFYGNDGISYYVAHAHKDNISLDLDGILQYLNRHTKVMHDHCISNYRKMYTFENLECVVHLERAVYGIEYLSEHQWAKDCHEFISTMTHRRNQLIAKGETCFPKKEADSFEARVRRMVRDGFEEVERNDKRWYTPHEINVLNLIQNYYHEFFAWLYDFSLPATNSLSERSLRTGKDKTRVSGQFLTTEAADDFATLLSYIRTCKKHGISEVDSVRRLTEGNPYTVRELFGDEELKRMGFDALKVVVTKAEKAAMDKCRAAAEEMDIDSLTQEELKPGKIRQIAKQLNEAASSERPKAETGTESDGESTAGQKPGVEAADPVPGDGKHQVPVAETAADPAAEGTTAPPAKAESGAAGQREPDPELVERVEKYASMKAAAYVATEIQKKNDKKKLQKKKEERRNAYRAKYPDRPAGTDADPVRQEGSPEESSGQMAELAKAVGS